MEALKTDNSAQQSTFVDPYNFRSNGNDGWTGGFWNAFTRLVGYDTEAAYNAAKVSEQRDYERQSVESARAWDEWYAKNKYQWAVEDLKKAGLNPWLAVQNGLSGGSTAQSASAASNPSNASSTEKAKSSDIVSMLFKVLIAAMLMK